MQKIYTKNEILTELSDLIDTPKLTEWELENTLNDLVSNLKAKTILSQQSFSEEDIFFFIACFDKFLDFSITKKHPIFTALTDFLTSCNFTVKLKPHHSISLLYYEDEKRYCHFVFASRFESEKRVQELRDKTDTIYTNTHGMK